MLFRAREDSRSLCHHLITLRGRSVSAAPRCIRKRLQRELQTRACYSLESVIIRNFIYIIIVHVTLNVKLVRAEEGRLSRVLEQLAQMVNRLKERLKWLNSGR